MLSTNRHERQSVHPWYMRRPPLVSVSLRKRRFLCLERERRNPAAWTMQQKCCNNNTRRSLPASPDTIRYYLYTFHPPPDRPTNQQRTASRCPKENPPDQTIIIIHIPITQRDQCKIHQLHQYLPDFPRPTRDLPYLTLPHLTSPYLSLDPTQKTKLPH